MIFSDLPSPAEAGFAKAGNRYHPGSSPGQAFSGSCLAAPSGAGDGIWRGDDMRAANVRQTRGFSTSGCARRTAPAARRLLAATRAGEDVTVTLGPKPVSGAAAAAKAVPASAV